MLSRRSFVQVMGAASASALLGAHIAARGREAAIGEGFDFEPLESPAIVAQPIRLSSNENPVGPPRASLDAIVASLGESNRYPFEPAHRLTERLAALHGVDQGCIVVGAGSGEILRMAVHNWTSPTRPLVSAAPSFEDPVHSAELIGTQRRT
jgi:histidinol-phosphate/aromatic aminotransferase/cobyric acid decarboxylase-like protein